MSGISRITALEIFTQPDDLEFRVDQDGDKWAFAITRGSGHNFKLLITAQPVCESSKEAVQAIADLLESICSGMTAELSTPSTMAAQFVNPNDRPLDDANMLSGEIRERIVSDLTAIGVASTYTYKTCALKRGEL
jgi:hypothetical protein